MEYFTNVKKVKYEGIDSKNPLAFKIYNAEEIIGGKTMEEHLKFSVAYWHTFAEELTDPFGSGTAIRPWDNMSRTV
ncbi:hypothetical protein [Marinilactibacillus psychrotolerans]|uniref:hypothetical protein n=1 Tax=Marinilactibacillus psychrotolerans TaxID=191770 RepID=UPI0038228C76